MSFETALFTAQAVSDDAGSLRANGAMGGPVALSAENFFIGINDPVGLNPTAAPFDSRAFSLFNAWMNASGQPLDVVRARRAIARGQEIFNTKPIVITGVAGLNNQTFASGVTVPDPFIGTCTTCHDTPNAGDHSVKAPLNIGLTDASRRTADMPLYTLRRISTGETMQTTDPGRAMVTGKWADIGKFKGPILRALAARAPYFHNGFAATLDEVIDFYESRFNIGLTARERSDLIAFLKACRVLRSAIAAPQAGARILDRPRVHGRPFVPQHVLVFTEGGIAAAHVDLHLVGVGDQHAVLHAWHAVQDAGQLDPMPVERLHLVANDLDARDLQLRGKFQRRRLRLDLRQRRALEAATYRQICIGVGFGLASAGACACDCAAIDAVASKKATSRLSGSDMERPLSRFRSGATASPATRKSGCRATADRSALPTTRGARP